MKVRDREILWKLIWKWACLIRKWFRVLITFAGSISLSSRLYDTVAGARGVGFLRTARFVTVKFVTCSEDKQRMVNQMFEYLCSNLRVAGDLKESRHAFTTYNCKRYLLRHGTVELKSFGKSQLLVLIYKNPLPWTLQCKTIVHFLKAFYTNLYARNILNVKCFK